MSSSVLDAPGAAASPETTAALGASPPRPFSWRLASSYSVANLGAAAVYSLFNFGMPLYLETYQLNPSLIGLLANERSFVGAFIQPIVGWLSDRTRTRLGRRRPYFLAGIPLMALALLILAVHPPFWVMLGIMTIAGFFLSIAWDPYMALLADLFPPDQRGRVGGLVSLVGGLGTVLFLILALNLWERQESLMFLLTFAFLVLTWAYTFVTVREPASPDETAPAPRATSPVAYVKSLRPYPEAAKYVLAITFFWLGTGGAVPFITLFAKNALGATEGEAFLLPLIATVINAGAAVPVGYLADKYGKQRVMTGGLLLFGVFAYIGSQTQTLWQAMVALGFVGLANAAMAQINPLLADLVPKARMAEFIGLASAVFSFAQPLGSVLAGGVVTLATALVSPSEAYRWAFVVAGTLVLIAAALLQTVYPERAAAGGPATDC